MALAILKKFSLADLAEGWTDECHILYKAVTYADVKALQELDQAKLTEADAVENIIKFVKEHVVSGKVMKLAEDGKQSLEDLAKDEIAELPLDTITNLFNQMNGGKLDPKGSDSVAPSEPVPTNSVATTTTS